MTELRGFVSKFLPLYHLDATVNSLTRYGGGEGGGGQRSGMFSGGNARGRTNFSRRPAAFLE